MSQIIQETVACVLRILDILTTVSMLWLILYVCSCIFEMMNSSDKNKQPVALYIFTGLFPCSPHPNPNRVKLHFTSNSCNPAVLIIHLLQIKLTHKMSEQFVSQWADVSIHYIASHLWSSYISLNQNNLSILLKKCSPVEDPAPRSILEQEDWVFLSECSRAYWGTMDLLQIWNIFLYN